MRGRGQIMSIYHKTKLNLRKDQKEKKIVRGQIMSEYTKTELNLRKDQKVKKEGEGSNYVGIY